MTGNWYKNAENRPKAYAGISPDSRERRGAPLREVSWADTIGPQIDLVRPIY